MKVGHIRKMLTLASDDDDVIVVASLDPHATTEFTIADIDLGGDPVIITIDNPQRFEA